MNINKRDESFASQSSNSRGQIITEKSYERSVYDKNDERSAFDKNKGNKIGERTPLDLMALKKANENLGQQIFDDSLQEYSDSIMDMPLEGNKNMMGNNINNMIANDRSEGEIISDSENPSNSGNFK